jgi:tetratricopeptide (TPR) repeat protein
VRSIPFFRASAPLTPVERLAKRRLVIQDTLALLGIFASTCLLGVLTYLIFQSYSQHQRDAAARWKRRGEEALVKGNANAAVFDLRTALGYARVDRVTEMELASALAQAGRLQEATAYFNTLWDKEPGNGIINLQLARLAVRQQQTAPAIEHYHAAIYGVWEGDGAIRRRQVRLELVRYLISQGRFGEARDELLIAAGNDTTTQSLLEVAGLLAQAHAPNDALRLYREVATRRPIITEALEGAGQMAFAMGHYRTANLYLDRAVTVAGSGAQPLVNRPLTERNLQIARAVLATYPSPQLPERERLRRVIRAYQTARARLANCSSQVEGGGGRTASAQSGAGSGNGAGVRLASLGSEKAGAQNQGAQNQGTQNQETQYQGTQNQGTQNRATQNQGTGGAPNADEMAALAARWQKEPSRLRLADLEKNPEIEAAAMQLVYDTEQITARACGQPTGLDAILLRIAGAPDAVDQ